MLFVLVCGTWFVIHGEMTSGLFVGFLLLIAAGGIYSRLHEAQFGDNTPNFGRTFLLENLIIN
jgi:hypothetical protein